ncbi:CDP-diacylglycerol--glycerol-3-phosphate 3-phosphatidyltransferase [Williamsia muralis]|uniref:CDP-diacylglycerol--glycerol-3-phosphate 3-phosphatidyltransferase n=1 Tax=Williamsia marianensis TaxID=85044 RepID=A0A495K5C4_WILMA|nr:CDP-diacylglycerol--glycerol-3-phosphate 3-phosphatidyltransferase [Williamsia muralis]RKR95754.1 CDP-diacylglycerol--glycerol-3-phosphate 3-phosphatidyltransferase [Williamsia muralis]
MADRLRRQVNEPEPDPISDPVSTDVPVLNLANVLTMFRIVLVPVFVVVLFIDDGDNPWWRTMAWGVFALAAVTDHYDGRIARQRGLITDFGKLADPIADKALIGSALIGLSVLGELPWWVTIVILARELGITVLRFWVLQHGVIPASRGGKLKTLLQAIAIGLFILPLPGPLQWLAIAVMAAALVATVVTGVDYVWQALAKRAQRRRDAAAARRTDRTGR